MQKGARWLHQRASSTSLNEPSVRYATARKWVRCYVDDQEKALRFYTEMLGFVKKADFSQGAYRWLTVPSPGELDSTEQRGSGHIHAVRSVIVTRRDT